MSVEARAMICKEGYRWCEWCRDGGGVSVFGNGGWGRGVRHGELGMGS